MSPNDFDIGITEWEIEQNEGFKPNDLVAYSAVFVDDNKVVYPRILIKEVGSMDYGGDWCEYNNGIWAQVGLQPNTNAINGRDYIAKLLPNDPPFEAESEDYRKWHRENFSHWIEKL